MLLKTNFYVNKHRMPANKTHHPFVPSSFEEGKSRHDQSCREGEVDNYVKNYHPLIIYNA